MDIQGKTAIVTGGSKGYGAGIAEHLRSRGATVWITGRDQAALDATAKRLDVHAMRADVTSGADWDALVKRVTEEHGRIDILINNAGHGVEIAPLDETSDEAIEQSIAINLTGALLGCRRIAGVMKTQGGGVIINISSGCARHAWPGWAAYSAAKAGMNQFARCLNAELRPFGVRVTTVMPYWGATDFAHAADIAGHPSADPVVRPLCMQPGEMGELIVSIVTLPDHLEMLDVTVKPMVQEIIPV